MTRALRAKKLSSVLAVLAPPAMAQVDQERAQEFFKEAEALCERDGGRLWGVSLCGPMVIADRRTQPVATSQPAPDGPRPAMFGLVRFYVGLCVPFGSADRREVTTAELGSSLRA